MIPLQLINDYHLRETAGNVSVDLIISLCLSVNRITQKIG